MVLVNVEKDNVVLPVHPTAVEAHKSLGWVLSSNTVQVRSVSDLPAPNLDGEHVLDVNTLYEFHGFVTSSSALRWSQGSKVRGSHLGNDGFVYTGTGAALRATNVPWFCMEFTCVAPAGSCLDLSADIETEFFGWLVGLYNCLSLGTISGYRVPTIKAWNCEHFAAGLTFTGTSEKVLVDGSPFRNAGAGAKAIRFDANFSTGIIDLVGNYFKNFEAGAVAISLDEEAEITDYALLRGNAFAGLSASLEGFGPGTIGWDVSDNAGVRNSRAFGSITMAGNATATTLVQDTWTKVAGTTIVDMVERFDMPVSNRIRYIDSRQIEATVNVALSVLGTQNNQMIEVRLYKNGEAVSAAMVTALTGSARADSIPIVAVVELDLNEYIEVWMRCTSGSNDATVQTIQMVIQG